MTENCLKLNEGKTDLILIGPANVSSILNSLCIGDSLISISSEVKYLGAVIDCHLLLDKHIMKICAACFIKICQIWRIRRTLIVESAKALVHANIISRLDHINMLLIGLPKKDTRKLQQVLNAAV